MNYLFLKLENEATFKEDSPERRAFASHLKLVAKALHDIEWVDSGDYAQGAENEAIRACLSGAAAERERLIKAVADCHMWQTINNQNYPSAWHDGIDEALRVMRDEE